MADRVSAGKPTQLAAVTLCQVCDSYGGLRREEAEHIDARTLTGCGTATLRPHPTRQPFGAYAPSSADIQSGRASVRSTHSAGGAPAFPAASTPPTMAQFVSTSPPTCAVVQKARS